MIRRMNERRFFPFIPILIIGIVLLAGYIVMQLWNGILPTAIHAGTLTYWQSVGLLVLSKILFGSFGRRMGPGRRRGNWPGREQWMNMTVEEREKLKEEWCKRREKF